MANTYPAFAFPLKPDALPKRLDSISQVVDLLNNESIQNKILSGSSRKGWLAWIVKRISEKYDLTNLDFMYSEPWLSEEGYYATILNGEKIGSVIETITSLLALFEIKPHELIGLDNKEWSEDSILKMLHESEPSLHPKVDDGDGLNYLFAYLKSFLAICEKAAQEGDNIVYAQFDGG